LIRTERLLLRDARKEDLLPLHEIFSDPRAMRYWDRPAHEDIEPTRRFLETFMNSDRSMREEYILEHEGVCVGKAGCWHKPEIGYILHPRLWGKGLMYEALSVLIPRIFERFPEEPVLTAEVDPRNTGSAALLRKLGFEQTDYKTKNFNYGGLELCDTAYYELSRSIKMA
jgi:RimJ/RimL family protein N-acetyltransferase